MTVPKDYAQAFAQCPLIAILRGIQPHEVDAIGDVLVDAGFTLIEVPLNSPQPLNSIERLARRLSGQAVVGAGTVLSVEQVSQVASVGGRLIVSPNCDLAVIRQTIHEGLASLPGCYTPTEAFAAIGAGAHALKFFPADAVGPASVRALSAVLPEGTRRLAVGGITPANLDRWKDAGIDGFGLGSALYSPGDTPAKVRASAEAFVKALR